MSKGSKRPIDIQRDSGGMMEVGLPEEGHVKEMYTIGDKRLLLIKERATYEMKFADQIDPERTNQSIPNVQQRVLQAGTEHELVQRVLLVSRQLFDSTYLPKIDCAALREHALDAVREVLAMERVYLRANEQQEKLLSQIQGQKLVNGFIVPSLTDLEQDLKNFMQRSDHFTRELFRMMRRFEGRFDNIDDLIKRAEKEKPANEDFLAFLKTSAPFIKFAREARNAVEHPTAQRKVVTRDFELDKNAALIPPTVEVIHPKYREARTSLTIFLAEMIRSLVALYGDMVAHLCARKATAGGFDVAIAKIPEKKRIYEGVIYSYAVFVNGDWQRIG